MATDNLRYSLLVNNFLIRIVYFYRFWASATAAALEGATSGFYLIKISNKMNGIVTMTA
jgi:hypothetical protein